MKLTHLIVLSAALLGTTTAVQAQSVTPNPAPTIITTAPYTITKPGYYQLGANLTVTTTNAAIITINASNVTLDFGGHYISGPQSPGTLIGVLAAEQGNVTVKNGTIAYCYEGVLFNGNGNTGSIEINESVQNMLVTYCTHIGVNFLNAKYSTLADSTLSNVSGATPTNGTSNYGVFCQGVGVFVTHNKFVNISGPTPTNTNFASSAIYNNVVSSNTCIAVGNLISTCNVGLSFVDAYQDTVVTDTTLNYNGGKAVGSNNSANNGG